jgi:RNA polymerase sigma factor (sigma-70 family)
MHELNDIALLRQYTEQNSEEAFATLVARHIDRVYSVALRHTGNPHQAEEITQAVFVIFARKSRHLGKSVILEGWLYQTARLTAATFIRSEIRRVRREQEAYMQTGLNDNESAVWKQIAPMLDTALAGLSETDRHAVVLRFFYGKSLKEVGAVLGGSEDAAKMRLHRAMEKLQAFFLKRGVTSTTATLAGAISVNSVQAAPIALAKFVTAGAMVKGAAASGSTLTLIQGALKIMAWTKAKSAVIAGVVVLLAAGTTLMTVKIIEQHKADESWRVRLFDSRVLDRISPQVKILPAQSSRGGGYGTSNDKRMGTGVDAETIVRMVSGFWSPVRTILACELPAAKYDFIASLPSGNAEALRQEIRKQFGVVTRLEMVETNVLLLTVKFPNAPGLRPSKTKYGSTENNGADHFSCVNQSVSFVAGMLEGNLQIPVIDQTGLTQTFDIDLKWNQHDPQHNTLKQALLDQLGLELVPTTKPVEMLVVEKAP